MPDTEITEEDMENEQSHCEKYRCYYIFFVLFSKLAAWVSFWFLIASGLCIISLFIHMCCDARKKPAAATLSRIAPVSHNTMPDVETGAAPGMAKTNNSIIDHPRPSIVAVVNRTKPEEKLGIRILQTNLGEFLVGAITPESPFRATRLMEGMEIKSINGIELKGKVMSSVMSTLTNTLGTIIVVAYSDIRHSVPPKKLRSVVAVVNKTSPDETLGINVRQMTTGRFIVGPLAPNSPFQQTDLTEGMEIKSINGVDLKDQATSTLMAILKSAVGSIIIVAETDEPPSKSAKKGARIANYYAPAPDMPPPYAPTETPRLPTPYVPTETRHDVNESSTTAISQNKSDPHSITAVVTKQTVADELGLKLFRTSEGRFFVSMLTPESPFHSTELKEGMEVKSINGVGLAGKDMKFPLAILHGAIGNITVTAETDEGAEISMGNFCVDVTC